MNTKMPKIAMGAWSWGAGAAGGDQVFGNRLFENDLKPVFDKALELKTLIQELRSIGEVHHASPAQVATAWAIAKGTLPIIGVTKVHQVEEAAAAAQIVLSDEAVSRLEKLGNEAGVDTLREWEKEMV